MDQNHSKIEENGEPNQHSEKKDYLWSLFTLKTINITHNKFQTVFCSDLIYLDKIRNSFVF